MSDTHTVTQTGQVVRQNLIIYPWELTLGRRDAQQPLSTIRDAHVKAIKLEEKSNKEYFIAESRGRLHQTDEPAHK